MRYYKVVSIWENRFFSSIVLFDDAPRWYHVEYAVDKWAYPTIKDSKLFVFDDLEATKRYCWNNFTLEEQLHKIKIFSCEILNPEMTKIRMCGYLGSQAIINFWEGNTKNSRIIHKNTVLCDAVKLIEEVKQEILTLRLLKRTLET